MNLNNRWTTCAAALKLAALTIAVQFAFVLHSVAAPGDLYVTDLATGSVMIYTPDGTASTFATGLTSPQGIAFDQSKNLYVVDAGDGGAGNGTIFKYDLATGTPVEFRTGLNNPIGVTLDGADLLVSENGADRVIRVPLDAVHNPGVFEIITGPLGLASRGMDQAGFFRYIANGSTLTEVVPPSGTLVTFDFSGDPSINVTADESANIFVSTSVGTISEIPVGGGPRFTFAAGFDQPTGLDFRPGKFNGDADRVGFLYVADPNTGLISQIGGTGIVSTFVDTGSSPNFLVFERNSPSVTPTPTPSPTATPSPSPTPSGPGRALNLSSRVDVETGDNVAIGGFIIMGGTTAKTVAIRAIGPSLADSNVASPLADPVLELYDGNGDLITMNNDWMDNSPADQGVIVARGLVPENDLESVLIATLAPVDISTPGSGMYTAVVRGNNGATGVGLVEMYDLDDPAAEADLGNLSTRGLVGTVDDVLIGGLIVGPLGTNPPTEATFVIRAIGPSLADATPPVADPLADPTLELHNGDGDLIAMNDNWRDGDNASDIEDAGLAPTDDNESAILANLLAGAYTAIVHGKDDSVGVGLVEVYHLPSAIAK